MENVPVVPAAPPIPKLHLRDPVSVAVHEASHAVAALASGVPVDYVTMTPNYERSGLGIGGSTYTDQRYNRAQPSSLYVYLAGKVGMDILHHRECSVEEAGAWSDFSSYFWTARAPHSLNEDLATTRALLEKHWPAVVALAGHLIAAPVVRMPEVLAGGKWERDALHYTYAGAESQRFLAGPEVRRLFEAVGFAFTAGPPPTYEQKVWYTLDELLVPSKEARHDAR